MIEVEIHQPLVVLVRVGLGQVGQELFPRARLEIRPPQGHVPGRQARAAADLSLAFQHQHAGPEVRGLDRGAQAGCAAADDDDVGQAIGAHATGPPLRPAPSWMVASRPAHCARSGVHGVDKRRCTVEPPVGGEYSHVAAPLEHAMRPNHIDLSGRTAIVTGAATGLGFAASVRLAESGATVWAWDRDKAALASAAAAWSGTKLSGMGTVRPVTLDIADPAEVQRGVDLATGELDILLTVAGVDQAPTDAADTTLTDWNRLIAVNLTGTFLCCRAVIPVLARRGYGRIVTVASIAGKEGSPRLAAYAASKAGVIGLTKSLGKELATTGIVVNCIAPVVFDTAMFRRTRDGDPALMETIMARIPMGRVGAVAEFAALAAWMCSDECSFTTGFTFDLTGGRATY